MIAVCTEVESAASSTGDHAEIAVSITGDHVELCTISDHRLHTMGHAASPIGNQGNLCKAPLHRPAIMLTCIPSTITDCNIILPHNSPSDAPEPEPLPSATYTNN